MKPSSKAKASSGSGKTPRGGASSSGASSAKSPRGSSSSTANPLGPAKPSPLIAKPLSLPIKDSTADEPALGSARGKPKALARQNSGRVSPRGDGFSGKKTPRKTGGDGAKKATKGSMSPRGTAAKPSAKKGSSSSNMFLSSAVGVGGVSSKVPSLANEEQPPPDPSSAGHSADVPGLDVSPAFAAWASGAPGADMPAAAYASASSASLRALHLPADDGPAAPPAAPQPVRWRMKIGIVDESAARMGAAGVCAVHLTFETPPAVLPTPPPAVLAPPARAADEPTSSDLRVNIELGPNGIWEVSIFEPEDEVMPEETLPTAGTALTSALAPVATPPHAASAASALAPTAATDRPDIASVRCKIEADDKGGVALLRFEYLSPPPVRPPPAVAQAAAAPPTVAPAAAAPPTVAPAAAAPTTVAPAAAAPPTVAPAAAAPPTVTPAAAAPELLAPPTVAPAAAAPPTVAPAAAAPVVPAAAAPPTVAPAAAAPATVAPPADVPSTAPPPAVASPIGAPADASALVGSQSGGLWVPPTLSVKLVELTREDQIAISITPSADGDGKLVCAATAAPVFAVVLTAS